ncbi:MAG: phospho-sugar mutase [Bacilli bacterium]|nr:phospho-sugar mutase [Bacilli bacterium]
MPELSPMDARIKLWTKSQLVSEDDKLIIKKMTPEEKADAFFKEIEFGTAGMRGTMGPGSNRLNFFTILRAAVCFGEYLVANVENARERGVVIAHDNRLNSPEFTKETAEILNCNGIKVYVFDSLRPTPELSFAVRHLNAAGGIVITASHNPKEYNGFKVYDETGCQLVPEKIQPLLDIIATKKSELETPVVNYEPHGETIVLGPEIDDEYCKQVLSIRLNPDLDKSNYKIVFTPQHGTSYVNAMRIFKEAGYNIIPVEEQCSPDPNFSNTLSPNPEDPKAYKRAIEIAKEQNAQLVVMTDPDADRVGIAYRTSEGAYRKFTGNEAGALLMDYVLGQRKLKGLLHDNGVMFNTIVTSQLGEAVASSYNIKTVSMLTGFKYIGNKIAEYEANDGPVFEFGYEESYGALVAPFARDKDGLQALLLYCELAVFYDVRGLCLDEVLERLQARLGKYFSDVQYSTEFKGADGAQKMKKLMDGLHEKPFEDINRTHVLAVEDYLQGVRKESGREVPLTLPKSDVIKFILDDNTQITVRPSGTEPKCKFYIGCVGNSEEEVDGKPQKYYLWLKNFLKL